MTMCNKWMQFGIITISVYAILLTMSYINSYSEFLDIPVETVTDATRNVETNDTISYCKAVSKTTQILSKTNSNNTASRADELAGINCRMLPDVLIVGMEKCGTATLRSFLGINPKFYIPPLKPSVFFSGKYEDITLADYCEQRRREEKPIKCTPEGMLRVEKMANGAPPRRVLQYIPNVTLIAIVREPSERALSHYVHFIDNGSLSKKTTFEMAIREENAYIRNNSVLQWSLYAERLKDWVGIFGAERILILDGDKFAKDPVTILKEVEKFVGVPNAISRKDFIYNKQKNFYCLKSDAAGCMGKSKGRPHPVMNPETRRKLKNFLKPHNERFYAMVGRRFPWDN